MLKNNSPSPLACWQGQIWYNMKGWFKAEKRESGPLRLPGSEGTNKQRKESRWRWGGCACRPDKGPKSLNLDSTSEEDYLRGLRECRGVQGGQVTLSVDICVTERAVLPLKPEGRPESKRVIWMLEMFSGTHRMLGGHCPVQVRRVLLEARQKGEHFKSTPGDPDM